MLAAVSSEPGSSGSILFVGQDVAGHWLVQENGGRLEGRFVSFATTMSFARAERHGFPGATVAVSPTPLVPQISFAPVSPLDIAARRAA